MDNDLEGNLELEKLTGADTRTLTAFLNAVRSNGSFSVYCEHFNSYLGEFFNKCFYKKEEVKKDLSIAYLSLSLKELKKIFNEVYKQRKEELAFLLEEKEYNYKDLEEIEKLKYNLIYYFGDKIGGYPAVASLNPEETIKLYKIFSDKVREENEALKEASKGKK